jgi:hypothetical protein
LNCLEGHICIYYGTSLFQCDQLGLSADIRKRKRDALSFSNFDNDGMGVGLQPGDISASAYSIAKCFRDENYVKLTGLRNQW